MMLAPIRSRLLLCAALLLLVLATPVFAQPSGVIAGRVTDTHTGRPVAGAELHLRLYGGEEDLETVRSDRRGRYRFDGLDSGYYVVFASSSDRYLGALSDGTICHPGLTFRELFGFRCGGPAVDPPPISLSAAEVREVSFTLTVGGAITGQVTEASTGEPVDGVRMMAYERLQNTTNEALTGADGTFRIGPLPTGRYRVSTGSGELANEAYDGIHCPGRFGNCGPVVGDPLPVSVRQVVAGIDFSLEQLGTIAGRVTAVESGAPLGGVTVFAHAGDNLTASVVTGPDGRYRIGGLFAGDYRVFTSDAPDHVDEIYGGGPCNGACGEAEPAVLVPVAIDQVAGGIDFTLEPGAAISGTVTAEETGAPLEGVGIRVRLPDSQFPFSGATGPDGRYRIGSLPAGAYRLHTVAAAAQGVADEAYDGVACGLDSGVCAVDAGPLVAVTTGEAVGGIDFSLEPLGAITGRVVDRSSGAPISGMTVLLWDLRGGLRFASTDVDGAWFSPPLPRGAYGVETEGWPEASEYVDQLYDDVPCFLGRCDPAAGTPVMVASGSTTAGIEIALPRGAAIEGRVTREDGGAPVAFAHVLAYDASGRFDARDQVDAEGRYRIAGLPDGDYHLVSQVGFGLVDEVFDRLQCVHGSGLACEPLEGLPVHAEAAAPPPEAHFSLASRFRPGVPCRQSPTRLCLAGDRFEVGIRHSTGGGNDAQGLRRSISDSAGAFTFFGDDNLEAVVRVVDACAPFDRFWVLAASLSDLDVSAGVRDTVTGDARFYFGLDFEPVLDSGAFDTCAAVAPPAPARVGPVAAADPQPAAAPAVPPAAVTTGTCVAGPETLCLLGGRFEVSAEWDDGTGGSGPAGAESLGDRSGYLWFHRSGAPEVAVKMIDACSLERPAYWLFAAGLTNSEVRVTVTDTVSGQSREIFNPLGQPFRPVRDLGTFDACP